MSKPPVSFPLADAHLRRSYDAAVRLAVHGPKGLVRNADSFCYGTKQFGRPMMALIAQKKLGPVRHALSQMVVAGTMTVNPPVQVRISSEGPEAQDIPSEG